MTQYQNNQTIYPEDKTIEQLHERELQAITEECMLCGVIATGARYEAEVLKERIFHASSAEEAGYLGLLAWKYKELGAEAHETSRIETSPCNHFQHHVERFNALQAQRGLLQIPLLQH